MSGDSIPITIFFDPPMLDVETAEVLQSWDDLTTGEWTDLPGSETAGTGTEVSANHT